MWRERLRCILKEFRNIYLERIKANKKPKIETEHFEGEAEMTTNVTETQAKLFVALNHI
jgi:hypothetical protein